MIDTWDAVVQLTTEHVELYDGRPMNADPLLTQLWEARHASIGAGGTRGGGEGSMLNYAAYELWEEIDGRVRAVLAEFQQPHAGDLAPLVSRMVDAITAAHAGNRISDAYADSLYALPGVWARRIRDLIDPPRVKELTAACPECGERYEETRTLEHRKVHGVMMAKEVVTIQAALRIPIRIGYALIAECHCCGKMWAGRDQLVALAEAIGNEVDFQALIELASPVADTADI